MTLYSPEEFEFLEKAYFLSIKLNNFKFLSSELLLLSHLKILAMIINCLILVNCISERLIVESLKDWLLYLLLRLIMSINFFPHQLKLINYLQARIGSLDMLIIRLWILFELINYLCLD